jgi:hypothetical protein
LSARRERMTRIQHLLKIDKNNKYYNTNII